MNNYSTYCNRFKIFIEPHLATLKNIIVLIQKLLIIITAMYRLA